MNVRNLRLTYAGVTSTLALFLAIGGTTAVGAQALLTGSEVQDDSLTGADVQNHSLSSADIRAGSLGSNAFSAAARVNLRGTTGTTGALSSTSQRVESRSDRATTVRLACVKYTSEPFDLSGMQFRFHNLG